MPEGERILWRVLYELTTRNPDSDPLEAKAVQPADCSLLVRVHVDADGAVTWERVRMNYTKKKK